MSMVRNAALCVLGVMALPCQAIAQVVIDGGTPTTVNINPNGSVTVGIAPSNLDGISHNTYNQFNVPKPGLDLDNRTVGARTIVNEVTGTSRSEINGPVEVLGQQAHVIVANPNGISVDGASFINTGRTVLTTGDISFNAREIAPGIFQENVVSTVTGGTIQIKGGGLSGQMDAVDLIAHSVKVNGPVTNTGTNALSSIDITAGQTRTEFDSSLVPGNLDQPWKSVTGGGVSDGEVLVEITAQGALRSNRIEIQVTDQGAGARVAGNHMATAREFILTADGTIDMGGATVAAATDATISGREVVLDDAEIRADNGILGIEATDASDRGILGSNTQLSANELVLTSEADIGFSADTLGSSQFITDEGGISLTAAGAFSDTNGAWESAGGFSLVVGSDVTLDFSTIEVAGSFATSTGGAFAATNTQVRAEDNVLISADEASFTGTDRRTEFVAETGAFILTTLGVNSGGDLVNEGALLQGQKQVAGLTDAAGTESEGAVTLDVAGNVANLSQGDQLAIIFGNAGDVVLRSGGDVTNHTGRLIANGDIKLVAAGDLLNLIDLPAGTNDPGVTEFAVKGRRQWWTLWLKRKRTTYVEYDYGEVNNRNQLATIQASGSIDLELGGDLRNIGGEINANGGDVDISAVQIETVGVGTGRAFVQRVCVLTCSYEGTGDVAYLGGTINAARDVNIVASDSLINRGGEIVALRDVNIKTPTATFEAVLVPTVVNRPGGLYNFWASDAAWIYLQDRFGGIIADTGNITLDTEEEVELLGATLTAGGRVIAEAGINEAREPRTLSPAFDFRTGLFRNIPHVSFE